MRERERGKFALNHGRDPDPPANIFLATYIVLPVDLTSKIEENFPSRQAPKRRV